MAGDFVNLYWFRERSIIRETTPTVTRHSREAFDHVVSQKENDVARGGDSKDNMIVSNIRVSGSYFRLLPSFCRRLMFHAR